jgi:hypothetical protein
MATTTYTLNVINDSELPNPTFAVFATLPAQSDFATLNLAWLTQQVDATNKYTFTWPITWGFSWAAQGTEPGYQWAGQGKLAADPNSPSECAATFGYNGDFQLLPANGTPDGYTLWITDAPTVPTPKQKPSSLGVTLGGSSVCATNAGPNLYQTYTLHPTYYIDAGNYVQGQMVDGASVTAFQELTYADGNTSLTATLGASNTWTVTPSVSVDFAARLADSGRS